MSSSRLTIPPELKRITQYIRRAEELDNDKRPQSRIVAYYCRQYAVQTGIQLSNSDAARACLSQLLSSLETEKKALAVFSVDECATICKNFALEIFTRADNEDRAGVANKSTAKTFYASAVFLKMIEQFGEDSMDEELTEKWKYARWKAMDINKAITEGRDIAPGGYGEMEAFQDVQQQTNTTNDNDISTITNTNDFNGANNEASIKEEADREEKEVKDEGTEVDIELGPPPAYNVDLPALAPPIPPPPSPPKKTTTPSSPPIPSPKQPSSIKSAIKSLSPIKSNNKDSISSQDVSDDALELTRFALAALEAKDTNLGRSRLEQALFCLKR